MLFPLRSPMQPYGALWSFEATRPQGHEATGKQSSKKIGPPPRRPKLFLFKFLMFLPLRPRGHEATRPRGHEATRPRGREAARPRGHEATRPQRGHRLRRPKSHSLMFFPLRPRGQKQSSTSEFAPGGVNPDSLIALLIHTEPHTR